MKNTFKYIVFIAVAAMTILSCNKEQNGPLTHKVKIYVDQENTKTSIDDSGAKATFNWSENDNTRFTVKENAVSGTGIAITTTDSWKTINLTATFETELAAEYTYSAFMAKNKTNSGAPKIPASQTSTATSYDPNADILIGQSRTFDTPQTSFSMKFARPVVINKMTLKGLDEGESVSSIAVSADKNIIGYFDTSTNTWTGQGTDITISTSQTVPASGQITVYFVTMPADDATLTVTVTTGKYIYTKAFTNTISFFLNQVTVFGVNSFTKNSKADYSGTYVLTNDAGTKMADVWTGNFVPVVDVTLEEGTIYYDPDAVTLANAQIAVNKVTEAGSYYGMYTMIQNGKYLYAAGSSTNYYLKGEVEPDVNAYWEISETDGNWSIEASRSNNNKVMQYNSGSPRFTCYSSASQSPVKLRPLSSVAPTPVITADASIALTSDAVSSATSTGATFNSNTSSVTASAYSNAECTVAANWLTVSTSGSGSSAVVNYTASANNTGVERTEYIKITATNSASRSVSKVISVTQAADVLKRYTLTFTSTTMQTGVNSYLSTFDTICDGFTWTLQNFNNNNKDWNYVKCGSKNDASVGTIVTKSAIPEAIGTVTVTVDAATASNVNSFKLYVASNSTFTSGVQEITKTIASGNIEFSVPNPAENQYYKIAVDCKKSSNGTVTISKVVYEESADSGSGGGGGDTPTNHIATINFNSGEGTAINSSSVSGDDSEGNSWTITTVGTTSFTSNSNYYQVGSSSKPATSITFTTTLAKSATAISLEAKFGGFSGTAGTVTLKVGDTSIGTGLLSTTNDVTVESSGTGSGSVLTVTVTGISKGVKCYYIKATYTN